MEYDKGKYRNRLLFLPMRQLADPGDSVIIYITLRIMAIKTDKFHSDIVKHGKDVQ